MTYLMFILINVFSFFNTADKVDLKIVVTNIKVQKGMVEIGVFNNAKSFLKKGEAYKSYIKAVTNDSVVFMLKDLPKGDYAVSIFHDVNSDKKCNLNFVGIPLEPYGFSNNVKPKLSKPSFNDCKLVLSANTATTIKLLH